MAELEEALIRADMGIGRGQRGWPQAVAQDRYDAEITDAEVRAILAREIAAALEPHRKAAGDRRRQKPFVILVAGVNGTGKTTTIGKLATRLTGEGTKVVLAAGDTFRAAAIEQLGVWASARRGRVRLRQGRAATPRASPSRRWRKRQKQNADILSDRHGRPPAEQDRR